MLEFNPDKIAHELSQRGEAWADRKGAAEALTLAANTMKRKCFLEAKGTMDERKAKAETDPEYLDLEESAIEARMAEIKAKVRHDTYKSWIEMKRTEQSTRRAQMNLS